MNISLPDDCGNSPRKIFIADFNKAFASLNIEYILEHVSDDVVWSMVGDKEINGKEAIKQELLHQRGMAGSKATSMVIHSIITHGREAAANGEFRYPEGERIAFCDVFQFTKTTGKTVKRITSYARSI